MQLSKPVVVIRPRLIRGLRIAWSMWWGIPCVLLVVFWVRSFWVGDLLTITGHIAVASIPGTVGIQYLEGLNPILDWRSFETLGNTIPVEYPSCYWGTFFIEISPPEPCIAAPYWFVFLTTIFVAAIA